MEICKYCNTNVEKTSGHLAHCELYKTWRDSIVTKEFLEYHFITLQKSANQIAKELGFPSSTMINRAIRRLGFKNRTHSESALLPLKQQQTKQTNEYRYGASHNFCRNHPSRIKWQQRLLLEEGITNVFQRDDVKLKIAQRTRDNPGSGNGCRISGPHKKIYNWITQAFPSVTIKNEHMLYKDDTKKSMFFYDIIVGTNLLLEINGDFYHANPIMYKASDMITFRHSNIPVSAQSLWERDEIKNNFALINGYKVIVIWEQEIKHKFAETTNELQQFIGDYLHDQNKENNKNYTYIQPL